MNTSTYKPRIASPYQQITKNHPFDFSAKTHPVRVEMEKHAGKYDLTATFQEDTQTVSMLKTPGLIAFVCTIAYNGKVIGIGRSNAIISETSKYFDRIIQGAWGYSLIDAVSKMTRTVDTLRTNPGKQSCDYEKETMIDDAYMAKASYNTDMISEKQKKFLLELIHTNIQNEDERRLRESQVDDFTREEASRAIQAFQK